MSHKEENNSIFEDINPSEQTVRLVKDVKVDDDSNDTREIDVLKEFQTENQYHAEKKSKTKMKVVEIESFQDENIPFEPTRELKIQRNNSHNGDNEKYREKVIVTSSDKNVGVKKIILGDETTQIPVYRKPKKNTQTIIRDVVIYLLMIAIVSILVILLLKYCNESKKDNRTILDMPTTSSTTTKLTSSSSYTETTTTITSTSSRTERTTTITSKKNNLQMPTTAKRTTPKPTTSKPTTPTTVNPKPESTTEPTSKPTSTISEEPKPTEPSDDDSNEQE